MSLSDISVRVEAVAPETLLGGIRPILHEIETLLAALVETGQGGSIDLRSLPMSSAEAESLDAALGTGEVQASVQTLGVTQVRETAVHGVWRVIHADEDGKVMADFVEVCLVPDILKTFGSDAQAALQALRARLVSS